MSHSDINELTGRYFRGQLHENEYEMLTDLLKNEKNLELFQDTKKQWEKEPKTDDLLLKNWTRVNYKISNSKKITLPSSNKSRYLYKFISYAAILILGLFLGGLIKYLVFDSNKVAGQEFVFETPRGEKSKVTLPDGSEVWLNAKSRLAYLPFNKGRKVELQGEAFFKVSHNKSKPFTVATAECEVKVLGTSFNVMAYNEFGRNEITLINGKVKVINDSYTKQLVPNQVMLIKNGQMNVKDIDAGQSIAWVDNKFNFSNIPLTELIKRLENWYDVDIMIENNINSDIAFTGVFKNEETIWQVLDALKVYLPIDYQRTNSRKIKIWIE